MHPLKTTTLKPNPNHHPIKPTPIIKHLTTTAAVTMVSQQIIYTWALANKMIQSHKWRYKLTRRDYSILRNSFLKMELYIKVMYQIKIIYPIIFIVIFIE